MSHGRDWSASESAPFQYLYAGIERYTALYIPMRARIKIIIYFFIDREQQYKILFCSICFFAVFLCDNSFYHFSISCILDKCITSSSRISHILFFLCISDFSRDSTSRERRSYEQTRYEEYEYKEYGNKIFHMCCYKKLPRTRGSFLNNSKKPHDTIYKKINVFVSSFATIFTVGD